MTISPSTAPSRFERLRGLGGQQWAVVAHVATLALSAAFLFRLNHRMWFLLDEWAFIVDRRLVGGGGHPGIWDPHNEHWVTAVVLVYRFFVNTIGLHSYLPFLALLILAHLVAAHLLWRVVCRSVSDRWVATGAVTVFLFLGVGWEDLTRAFQVTLIASLALGLGWLLLVPDSRHFERRDMVGWVLGVLALASSGVGLTMVGVVVLYGLARRGWRMALLMGSVPGAVYLLWFGAYGRAGLSSTSPPLTQGVREAPAIVWRGLTGAIDLLTGLEGLGVVAVVVIVGWSLRRARPLDPAWALALSCAAGAVGLLASAALRRSQLGVELGVESRYVYLVIGLLVPLACLMATRTLSRGQLRLAVAVGTAALLVVQVPVLVDNARAWSATSQDGRGVFVAAVNLVHAGEPLVALTPLPWFAPEVQIGELVMLADEGSLPLDVDPTAAEELTARTFLQIRGELRPAGAPPVPDDGAGPGREVVTPTVVARLGAEMSSGEPGCLAFTAPAAGSLVQVHPGGPVELVISPKAGGEVAFRYVAPEGEPGALLDQRIVVAPSQSLHVRSVARGPDLRLALPAGVTTVCGLSPSGA